MKTSVLAVAACVVVANAFPSIARQVAEQNAKRQATGVAPFPSIGGVPRPKGSVPFVEELQFVSTSGEHRVSPFSVHYPLHGVSIGSPSLLHTPRSSTAAIGFRPSGKYFIPLSSIFPGRRQLLPSLSRSLTSLDTSLSSLPRSTNRFVASSIY